MSDFGHGIGTEPYLPYGGRPHPPGQVELDLGTAHARARALAETGDLTPARSMIEEALAAGELRLGRDHAALVPLMVDLATIARRLGNLTEARNQLRRAHTIVVAASGPEHPTSLSLEGRIAAVGYRLGEPTEAFDRHLADVGARVLGPDHPAVRGAQQRLGVSHAPAPVPAPPADLSSEPAAGPVPEAPPLPSGGSPEGRAGASPEGRAGRAVAAGGASVGPAGPALEGELWVPARSDEPTVRRPRRRNTGATILVASLGALVLLGGIVVALQLFWPGGGPAAPGPVSAASGSSPPASAAPAASGAPATVTLADQGGTVTLTWTDPSDGQVPFVISGARRGDELAAIETVTPGQTTVTIYGLNINFDYCFTVAAVWSADHVRASPPSCTDRGGSG